jgi:hypothetical protein
MAVLEAQEVVAEGVVMVVLVIRLPHHLLRVALEELVVVRLPIMAVVVAAVLVQQERLGHQHQAVMAEMAQLLQSQGRQ